MSHNMFLLVSAPPRWPNDTKFIEVTSDRGPNTLYGGLFMKPVIP